MKIHRFERNDDMARVIPTGDPLGARAAAHPLIPQGAEQRCAMKRSSPKSNTDERIAAPLPDDYFDRESFRLKHVINIARGVGLGDWPLPPGGSWDRCWIDIKDAIDRGILSTGGLNPRHRFQTVWLNDLWDFAITHPNKRWDWLRKFCQRWAAGQGTILAEAPADGESAQAPNKGKRKTPKLTRGYSIQDAPLLKQMHNMIESGKADNVPYAADAVADKAVGKGKFASKSKRLEQGYMRKYKN